MNHNPRQIAFLTLRDIYRRGEFADVALDKGLKQADLTAINRHLTTELVYGCVRRQRSLDFLIDCLATQKSHQQHPDIRTILHLGLYQLCYLNQIPPSAAVDTTVELAKTNGFAKLSGFVNGLLRQYLRALKEQNSSESRLVGFVEKKISPENSEEWLGTLYSFPNWIINFWIEQLGLTEAEHLCQWFNQSPAIDLRINSLKTTRESVEVALQSRGISVNEVLHLPQGLRLTGSIGAIQNLPGYTEGDWSVQDSSAQLVGYLLDPQPEETIIDACAAPGGKTTHIAELMKDSGQILAFDKVASRLKKLQQSIERLQLESIKIKTLDSTATAEYKATADRVLLDAPCSGLGTLHRRADARWRQTPENIQELSQLQQKLLNQVASWVKPNGYLVYATCTLHPLENEAVIQSFLSENQNWIIETPQDFPVSPTPEGWIKIWPHQQNMDGFFMVKLKNTNSELCT